MWSRFGLSAPSTIVAAPSQHLYPPGAPIGAVLGVGPRKCQKNAAFEVSRCSKNNVSLSTCYGAMHVASLGPLGTHQAIAVAWGVNAWHLGIFFKVSGVCNLMKGAMHPKPHQPPILCMWGPFGPSPSKWPPLGAD